MSNEPDRQYMSFPFVGRARERNLLRQYLEGLASGHGGLVLVEGEPGIGKSRLAAEMAAEASTTRVRPSWGHCFDWAGTPPYWPWIEVLRDLVAASEPAQLRKQLGQDASLVAQVVPQVATMLPDLPPVLPMNPEQARFRLFDGIARLLMQISSEQPLLVILEDLHWADPGSLLLLEFVARHLDDASFLILGTYRDVEVRREHPLAATLVSLSRVRTTQRLSLSGLNRSDVSQLIRQMAGIEPPEKSVDDVLDETEGNPFFVTEVIHLLVNQQYFERSIPRGNWNLAIPQSVREAIGRRLDRLAKECNEVLRIASVIGREFDLTILQQVSGLTFDDLLPALDEAKAARMVEERERVGAYRFSHALTKEALYEELSSSRCMRLHGRAGETLETQYRDNLAPHYGDLARHFRLASFGDNLLKAIGYSELAGDQAMEQVAWESAAGHYERAVELLETYGEVEPARLCELLLKLGEAQGRAGVGRGQAFGAGNDPETRLTFHRAAVTAKEARLAELFAWAALGTAGFSIHHSVRGMQHIQFMKDALEMLSDDDSILRARLLARLGRDLYHWSMCDPIALERDIGDIASLTADARRMSELAITMARRLGDASTLVSALIARPLVIDQPPASWFEQQLTLANEAVELSSRTPDQMLEAFSVDERYALSLMSGDIDAASRELMRFADLIAPLKMPIFDWFLMIRRAANAICTGQYNDAEHFIQRAHEIWPKSLTASCQEIMLRRERGQPPGHTNEYFQSHITPDDPVWVAFYPFVLLDLFDHANEREVRSAMQRIDPLVLRSLPRTPTWVRSITLFGEFAAQIGEMDWVLQFYEDLLPFADLNIGTGFHDEAGGCVSYYLGLLAMTLEHWDESERHFAVSLELNQQWGYRPYVAYTHFAWADMLLQRGDPANRDQAIQMLAEASGAAAEIGMVRLKRLIDAARKRHRFPQTSPSSGLSRREFDVLRLLVEGKSDREIGQELFISSRTVMHHVASILRKLGVESRAAAAVYAVRNDLV